MTIFCQFAASVASYANSYTILSGQFERVCEETTDSYSRAYRTSYCHVLVTRHEVWFGN
jgi:hypothetical protein